MKILITGATGFLGKNLIDRLKREFTDLTLYTANSKTSQQELEVYTSDCDFVFNFAAIHRPKSEIEFSQINYEKFECLLKSLQKNNNKCPVLYTSSIQATNGSAYGLSKIAGEDALLEHVKEMNSAGIVYRLTNTFGKWANPNAHSVVATFCYNIAREIPIQITDRNHLMKFYYIDDVIDSFVERLKDEQVKGKRIYYELDEKYIYPTTLGTLADKLYYFHDCVSKNEKPVCATEFEQKLFETYKSYL